MAALSDPSLKPEVEMHHEERRTSLDLDDPHAAAVEDNPDRPEKLTWTVVFSVISLALGFVAPVSTIALVSGIITQLGTALGDTTDITWIISGWSVANAVSFSIAGNFSDVFGRRYVVLLGQALTIVGSIICATAHTTLTVVAGHVVNGFACGLIYVSYASISEILPNKYRGAGIALAESALTIPWAAFGPLISTSFFTYAALSWRWIYIIGAIYAVISLTETAYFYFPPARPSHDYEKSRWQQVREIDYVGSCLFAGGLCVLLVALSWAGTQHAWGSAAVIAPLVIGFVTLGVCLVYDARWAKQPVFPIGLLHRFRDYTVLLLVSFVSGMIYYSMSAILPQATLYIFTNDAIEIGVTQIPNGVGQMILGCFVSAMMGKIKHLKLQLIVWLTTMTVFTAALAAGVAQHKAAFMALQFFAIGPFPTIASLCYVMASLNVPLRHLGLAMGLIGTTRSAGGSFGNALLATIWKSLAASRLAPAIIRVGIENGFSPQTAPALIEAAALNAVGVPGAFADVPGKVTPEVEEAVMAAFKEVYVYAFQRVFYACLAFGAVAAIATFFVNDPSKYLTNHTAIHLNEEAHHREQHHAVAADVTDDRHGHSIPMKRPGSGVDVNRIEQNISSPYR